MTKIFIILALLVIGETSFTTYKHPGSYGKWVVERTSSLSIQGETNVNKFQCDATEYLNIDTLFYTSSDDAGKLLFTNSVLRVDIRRFDCHSRYITSDFRSALKSDKDPLLNITFVSLDQFYSPCNNQSVKGVVDIKLADMIKRFTICYAIKTLPGNRIGLDGSQEFTFSDFNLRAPKKFAGLIRTKEKVKVNFHLFFKAL